MIINPAPAGFLIQIVYKQVDFYNLTTEQKEIIIAVLSEMGFEGFVQEDSFGEEENDHLKAFISADNFEEKEVADFSALHRLLFTVSDVEDQNWNESWESNFQPILIDEFVFIRAGFHQPGKKAEHEIVITPKMSFGTGHHATTSMMIRMMKGINFSNKKVLDFGTGAGVLAILAEKLEASEILAIDNDDWSIQNARENFLVNHCRKIHLIKNSTAGTGNRFDIILANIIRIVIEENFSLLVQQLLPGGILLVSGLLENDKKEISLIASRYNLKKTRELKEGGWLCLEFQCQ